MILVLSAHYYILRIGKQKWLDQYKSIILDPKPVDYKMHIGLQYGSYQVLKLHMYTWNTVKKIN